MKRNFFILLFAAFAMVSAAQNRSMKTMQEIADFYASAHDLGTSVLKGMSSTYLENAGPENEAFAVFSFTDSSGFIVVSTRSNMPSVLATGNGELNVQENTALKSILESYVDANVSIANSACINSAKNNGSARAKSFAQSVTPLLHDISFSQTNPYNLQCPEIDGRRAVAGCTATTMAQIMAYYRSPTTGSGSVSYTTKTNNIEVNWDFSNTTFDWKNILDSYSGSIADADSSPVITNTNRSFVIMGGEVSFDQSYPTYLKLTKIYNYSGETLNGKLSFIAADTDGTFISPVGGAKEVQGKATNTGYGTTYIVPGLLSSLEDGDYRLYIGFQKEGEDSWNIVTIDSYTKQFYITVKKTGTKYTFDGHDFACSATATEVNAVATLVAACGAACESDYGVSATSGSMIKMAKGLCEYFGYDADPYVIASNNCKPEEMHSIIQDQLTKFHPVIISGKSSTGKGHSFIIDGYDNIGDSPLYHINWGWNGTSDGYFLLTNMLPEQAGTGGIEENYSNSFSAYMNVMPDDGIEDGSVLTTTGLATSTSIINVGSYLIVELASLKNASLNKAISGQVVCYLVDDNGNRYAIGNYMKLEDLQPGYAFGELSKSLEIPANIPSGDYHIALGLEERTRFFSPSDPIITIINSKHEAEVKDAFDRLKTAPRINLDEEAVTINCMNNIAPDEINSAIDRIIQIDNTDIDAIEFFVGSEEGKLLSTYLNAIDSLGLPVVVDFNMNESYETIILPFLWKIPEGWSLYSISANKNDVLTLQPYTNEENGNKPFVVYAPDKIGTCYQFVGFVGSVDGTNPTEGYLTGVLIEGGTIVSNCFVIGKKDELVAFYKIEDSKTVDYGKCYLVVPESVYGAYYFTEEDSLTGVVELAGASGQGIMKIYDLNGRVVKKTISGHTYIKGGKTFLAR